MVKLGRESTSGPLPPSTRVQCERESEVPTYPQGGWLASRVRVKLTPPQRLQVDQGRDLMLVWFGGVHAVSTRSEGGVLGPAWAQRRMIRLRRHWMPPKQVEQGHHCRNAVTRKAAPGPAHTDPRPLCCKTDSLLWVVGTGRRNLKLLSMYPKEAKDGRVTEIPLISKHE